MFAVGLLSWWYGAGWKRCIIRTRESIASVYDYFSIDLLLRSWFAPFRQISAGHVSGSIDVQWRAFVDRLISRCIGACMRTILIVTGIVTMTVVVLTGLLYIIFWACVPALPFVGLLLTFLGWLPWQQ